MSDRFFPSYEDDYPPRRESGRAPLRREPVFGARPVRQEYDRNDYDRQEYDPRGEVRLNYHPRPEARRDDTRPSYDQQAYDRQGATSDPRGFGQRDYEQRDYEQRDYDPRDYDPRGQGQRDYGRPDLDRQSQGRSDYSAEHSAAYAAGRDPWDRAAQDEYGRDLARAGQVPDPRLPDYRLHDPRLHDPREYEPGQYEPRLQDPRLHDPRLQDPHAQDTRPQDNRADAGLRTIYPRQNAPEAAESWAPSAPIQPMFARPNYPEPSLRQNPDRAFPILQWAGTICSSVILVAAVYWGYELAVRDVQGIPVVRAAAGPLRIAPDVPGGKIAPNQGLAVNAIAASGATQALPEQVTLAPAPLALTAEDVAPQDMETQTVAQEQTADSAQTLAPLQTATLAELPEKLPDDMPISDAAAVEAALNMALAEGGPTPEPVTKSTTDAAQPLADETNLQDTEQVTAPPTAEIDPNAIPVGTKMVQLGAFDDEAAARSNWADLQTRFAELIGSKAMVVQQAKSGGRMFYRLRAHGFADEDETRRFCAALLAENASCIPVAQR